MVLLKMPVGSKMEKERAHVGWDELASPSIPIRNRSAPPRS